MLVTLQNLKCYVSGIQKSLLSNFFSHSTHSCLPFSERLSFVLRLCSTPSIFSFLDCMTPRGWRMHLVSHLDLSTITSQALCRYCSLFLCTIPKAVYQNILSIPLCLPCLMLSLWTRGLASMVNIPWDDIGRMIEIEGGSYSDVAQANVGLLVLLTKHF